MAYSHADDVDQNANRGEKSEEVFLHHNLTRFRKHHRHAKSPHGQQIGGDVLHGQLIGDMEEHLSMLIELWLPSDGANCQLSTWTPGMGHFSSTELSQKRKYSHFDDNSAQETKTGSYNNCFLDEAAPRHRLWTAAAGWIMPHNEELD